MRDTDSILLSTWLAKRLNDLDLAYLHVMRSDFKEQKEGDVLTPIREHYQNAIIGNMGYTAPEAADTISQEALDAVSFGTSFLANPDLPDRFAEGAPLNEPDQSTFYTSGPSGYTDYPVLDPVAPA
jgi:N-ethylmaleimide reductase